MCYALIQIYLTHKSSSIAMHKRDTPTFLLQKVSMGFIFYVEQEDLNLTDEVGRVITGYRWEKFFKNTLNYNIQTVKEFYSNLINISQKNLEVFVRGRVVQYSERTLNMMLGVNEVDDSYKKLFEKADMMIWRCTYLIEKAEICQCLNTVHKKEICVIPNVMLMLDFFSYLFYVYFSHHLRICNDLCLGV